jgi:hypothetical protein
MLPVRKYTELGRWLPTVRCLRASSVIDPTSCAELSREIAFLISNKSAKVVTRIGEVVADGDSDQVVVTTLADLFDIKKAISRDSSAQKKPLSFFEFEASWCCRLPQCQSHGLKPQSDCCNASNSKKLKGFFGSSWSSRAISRTQIETQQAVLQRDERLL